MTFLFGARQRNVFRTPVELQILTLSLPILLLQSGNKDNCIHTSKSLSWDISMANNNPSNLNVSILSFIGTNGVGSIRFTCVGIREPARCKVRISFPIDDSAYCEVVGINELTAPASDTLPGTYEADIPSCAGITTWPDTGWLGFVPTDMYIDIHGGDNSGDTNIDNQTETIIVYTPGGILIERLKSFLGKLG